MIPHKKPVAPAWRAEPYRVFFPLAMLLAWAGVLHWAALAAGVTEEYRSIFHALTQVQGFMTCLAIGFLFTFVPRRTGGAAPSTWEMAVAAAMPVLLVAFAWQGRWMASQAAWLVLLLTLGQFVIRRLLSMPSESRSGLPASLVWVPLAILAGFTGSILTAVGAARGVSGMWLHDVGRGFVLQGMTAGLVCGIAPFLIPAITRGTPPPRADARRVAAHLLLATAFFGSFFLDPVSLRFGFVVRAGAVVAALLLGGVHRRATFAGLNRRLARVGALLVPAGFAIAAAFPERRVAALHVAFIGGFALLGFAISIHVFLAHGGVSRERLPALRAIAVLIAFAVTARALVDLDPQRFLLWIGIASTAFLAATLAWTLAILPALTGAKPSERLPIRQGSRV